MNFKYQNSIDEFKREFILVGGDPELLTTNEEYIEYIRKISDDALLDEFKHGLLPELCKVEMDRRSTTHNESSQK